jgi:hypothetical protein
LISLLRIIYISEFGVFIAIDATKVFILIIDYALGLGWVFTWGTSAQSTISTL